MCIIRLNYQKVFFFAYLWLLVSALIASSYSSGSLMSFQELIRQGAASISYVPVQLDGFVGSQPKTPVRNTSAYHSRLIDKMRLYSPPILPDHSGSVHSIPVTINQQNRSAMETSPNSLLQPHSFPTLQSHTSVESSAIDLARPPTQLSMRRPSTAHSLHSIPQPTPKRMQLTSLDAAAAILAQLDRLRALQAASASQRKSEGATVPLEPSLPFSGPPGPPPDQKVLKSAMEKPLLGHWQSVSPKKIAEIAVLPDNYCDSHEYPQTRLDLDQLQRLDAHFIYNRSCSPQFFQCSVGQTFVLNCPGDDQAFDPAISSCNFKNSIKLCPEYDHVMHCSIREQCTPNQFACCALPQQCIDLQRRCDGHRDCADGEDENNCPSCARNEFACVKNGLCISAKKRCDGRIDDCQDGSNLDEMGCSKNETYLTGYEMVACWGKFVCDSQATLSATGHSVCLDWAQHCDGHRDCAGGEDELNCKLMEAKYLLCENQKQSVRKEQWCNGKEDCLDGSDEKYCY